MLTEFSRQAFTLAAGESARRNLCSELAAALLSRLRQGDEFHATVKTLIAELRALGHDLWSFDESDDMEAWAPNYHVLSGPGVVITFTPETVEVQWSVA